jgi:hypothetical protein
LEQATWERGDQQTSRVERDGRPANVVVGAALVACGRRGSLRGLGVFYPLLVLLVIVPTGNHFFDAACGGLCPRRHLRW